MAVTKKFHLWSAEFSLTNFLYSSVFLLYNTYNSRIPPSLNLTYEYLLFFIKISNCLPKHIRWTLEMRRNRLTQWPRGDLFIFDFLEDFENKSQQRCGEGRETTKYEIQILSWILYKAINAFQYHWINIYNYFVCLFFLVSNNWNQILYHSYN